VKVHRAKVVNWVQVALVVKVKPATIEQNF
jgi:hypothetical protein